MTHSENVLKRVHLYCSIKIIARRTPENFCARRRSGELGFRDFFHVLSEERVGQTTETLVIAVDDLIWEIARSPVLGGAGGSYNISARIVMRMVMSVPVIASRLRENAVGV